MSNRYAHIFAALKEARDRTGQDWDHRELVSDLTKGRTSSLKDLSPLEETELYRTIRSIGSYAEACDRMRKKIISLLMQCGYRDGQGRPDMYRIYAFTLKYGYLHKPLNDYKYNELPKLVTQVENVYRKFVTRP